MKSILLAGLLLAFGTANAATTTYLDRVSFEGASASLTTETFNSFVSEVPFHTTPLDVGDFTISMTGNPSTASGRNSIDLTPHLFPEFNVDGSTLANVLTFNTGDKFILTFDNPIYSFGADFGDFNDSFLRTNILIGGTSYSPAIDGTFWGIVSDIAFSTIEFVALANDGYGIDNISYSSTVGAVPIPAAAFMFAPALLGFFGLRRKVNKVA